MGWAERAHLAGQGISVEERTIARLAGSGGRLDRLVFKDGTSLAREVLFFHGPVCLSSRMPQKLGCELTSAGRIQVDEAGRTSVPGLYAAGDGARRSGQHPATQVILAAASGALAGIALHQELVDPCATAVFGVACQAVIPGDLRRPFVSEPAFFRPWSAPPPG